LGILREKHVDGFEFGEDLGQLRSDDAGASAAMRLARQDFSTAFCTKHMTTY
jgi:hypothetical protein